MDIVKKHWISIACGVVALAMLISVFFPTGSFYSKLVADMKTRQTEGQKIEDLRNRTFKLPPVFPDPDAQLQGFPNDPTIEKGKELVQRASALAASVRKSYLALNQRQLLRVDNSGKPYLPTPSDDAQGREFRRLYLARLQSGLNADIKGTVPATPEDVKIARDKIWTQQFAASMPAAGIAAREAIEKNLIAQFNDVTKNLASELQTERAKRSMVYVDPTFFRPEATLAASPDAQPPTPEAIFWAHINLWIQESVAASVYSETKDSAGTVTKAGINARGENVTHHDAPVKRLLSLDIAPGFFGATPIVANAGQPSGGAAEAPQNGKPGYNPAISLSGRTSNSLFDVVRFDLRVVIDPSRVPDFMLELGRGRLMSVNNVSYATVDGQAARNEGFIYGDRPVVVATFHCEALFLREWTFPLMPRGVRMAAGIGENTGPGTPGESTQPLTDR